MAIAQRYVAQQQTGRGGPSGLADVLEVLLDKGLVIDAFVRVSLVGIELLTIDARVVVASVDTYLRFAEAVNRLDLLQANNAQTLGDLVGRPSGSASGRNGGSRDQSNGRHDGSRRRELEERPSSRRERASAEDRDQDQRDQDQQGATEGDDQQPARDASARDDRQSGGRGESDEDRQDRENEGGDGGLLSRIKQRGQAF